MIVKRNKERDKYLEIAYSIILLILSALLVYNVIICSDIKYITALVAILALLISIGALYLNGVQLRMMENDKYIEDINYKLDKILSKMNK